MKSFIDNDLKEQIRNLGLNPNDPSFLQNPIYSKIKNKRFIMGKLGAVTYDYYIKKNWFKNEIIKQNQGRFDIGASKTSESVSLTLLIDEICQEALDSNENDEALYNPDNVRRKLVGNPSGIRNKLKNKIAFDLNNYKDQEFEKLKLLKLLYSIEKNKKNKINITSLLSYLSLENVEKEIIGDYSVHGEIITELLSEIRIDLDESFHKIAFDTIWLIVTQWNEKLLQVSKISRMPYDKSVRIHELERIKQYMVNLKNRLPDPKMISESNVMEAFYLRIMQLQLLCRTEDINRITRFILESAHTKELLNNKQGYNSDFTIQIIDELGPFIEQHKQKLAKIVYQKNTITDSEISTISKWAKHVPTLLDSFKKQMHTVHEQPLSPLFIISCLQEILLSETLRKGDDEYEFKNDYYLSDRKGRALHPTLDKMTNNISVEEALELVWVTKIARRMHANLGVLDEHLLIKDIETLANEFIAIIAKLPDLETMLCWNEFLLSQVIVAENAPILNYAGIFDNIIRKETGYSCRLHSMGMFQYFDITQVANILINTFLMQVKQHIHLRESKHTKDKRILPIEIDEQRFIAIYAFDDNLRYLIIHNFLPIRSDDEIELMKKVGLGKFVDNISL
ncbi:hypothetical protein [Lysinibacillus fusiformis]|uniref:hypothetical protein n=1 Tax=Lysinibacillus fusiformis TaxID=28031 RepID=UPI0021BF85D8|nr:hypothetical protein [Lysinibacillus fusiformis]UXJ69484.1 hypothetical protein N5069_02840 [Lysinibacillus fusiformis]